MQQELVPSVIRGFSDLSEQDIAALEHGPGGLDLPAEDRALLYALRVSRCVPQIKNLSTLGARCSVAHRGAGGTGLDAARNAPNWPAVKEFLASLYLARFDALADELVHRTEAVVRAARGSTPIPVRIERAVEQLGSVVEVIARDLPAVGERAERWIASLRALQEAVTDDAPTPISDVTPSEAPPENQRSPARENTGIRVEITHTPVICFALEQVGTPIVPQVRFLSHLAEPTTGLLFECSLAPDLLPATQFAVPELRIGEGVEIGPLDLRLPAGRLREVLEAERSRLQWRLLNGDEEIAAGERELEVLAYNQWPGSRAPGALLAAFVTPNHPVVSRILRRVRDRLQANTQDGAIEGYQSRSPKRVLEQLRALYETIQELGITYIGLPASFEKQGQKVRLPDVVLDGQMGNCLDLSVLFASCLEQMGLAPLIILVQGHAFPAVWMLDERFPEVLVPDVSRLRNQIELGQIVVFDSSTSVAAGQPRLEVAVDAGRRHLTSDETFVFALDIRAARTDRYRPLPIRMSVAPEDVEGEAPNEMRGLADVILEESFQVLDEPEEVTPAPPPTTVDARFKVWKDRLLDLSLHNRLLNFRPGSGQAIPLDVPSISQFEDLLASGERFQILPRAPRDAADQRSRELAVARDEGEARRQQLLADLVAKRVHAGYPDAELYSRARELARQAKTDLEEGGVTTTFAAIGLLKWYESPTSEITRYAPLLLVPLKLEYEPRTQRVLMRRADDETVGNVTLSEKMRRDFAIELSVLADLQADESGIDVQAVLRDVRVGIQRMPRWEVLEEVHIGHFTFAKFLMWKDLEENRVELLTNPVVRHIAEGGTEPFPDPVGETQPTEMDDAIAPAELPVVVDADSTQLAAVVSAVRGRSFVLEGPPGTGKSQTITNLIAGALAAGKTVLFVSEKMAALEVVHRRLEQIGLGDFCLELHSNKANKKQVLESVRRAYERGKSVGDADWQGRSSRLQALRQHLNGYSRALHQPWPIGLTFYRASSRVLELKDAPTIAVPAHIGPSLEQATFQNWLEKADALAVTARRVEPVSNNPWRVSEIVEWSGAIQGQIETNIAAVLNALKDADVASGALAVACGVEAPKNVERLDALAAAARCASTGGLPRTAWAEDRWRPVEREAQEWIALVERQSRERDELDRRWSEEFHDADLQSLRAVYAKHQASNRLVAWFALRGTRKDLKRLGRGKLPERGLIQKDLQTALGCRERAIDLVEREARLASALGTTWSERGSAPALRALIERSNVALGISRQLGSAGVMIPDRLVNAGERTSADGRLAELGRRAAEAATAAAVALRDVGVTAHIERVLPDKSSPDQFEQARQFIASLRDALPSLRNWCLYAKSCVSLVEAGLTDVVIAHREGRVRAIDLRKAIEHSVLNMWVMRVRDAEPALCEFSGDTHDETVTRFREEDRNHMNAARQMVQSRIDAKRPAMLADPSSGSEAGVLLGQIRLQRRHMAIRKLFDRIPNLLPKLKPCMLMSPLSVAQYLPATGRRFDLVVFDEASQIGTHDAIGAIGRGNQVIVVGDSRQLPPTSFFQRNLDDDRATDDNDVVELESVLDEACRVRIPRQWLGWHYRSRHDSLIDFSNRHYYESRLQIYASAHWQANDLGVQWVHVPDGVYQLGRTRTNPREAERVVETLVGELRKVQPGQRSFGVVTFSVSQQTEIENRLDQARVQYPEIEGHFSEDLVEPVFVKNLENVQGDERDEIFLSICYGPDERGRIYMNFGPINRTGGERRLNVAITRARQTLRVFSTLRHDQIDLARTNQTGARHLRAFLQYAAERGTLQQQGRPSAKAFDSEFERQVHDELSLRGYDIDCQVGCAGYRIDLAVRHPRKPGAYALGIECDGAPYHSASTARDRDRLRQQVLEGLGWTLCRVWSSDWWFDRQREVEKVVAAVEAAFARAPVRETPLSPVAPVAQPTDAKVNEETSAPVMALEGPPTKAYRRAELKMVRRAGLDIHSPEAAGELRSRVEEVVRVEGPVHIDDLARSVARCFGVGRVTERVRATVWGALESLAVSSQASIREDFAWPAATSPDRWEDIRVAESGEDPRDLDQVPLEEIANAMRWHLSHSLSIPFRELARATLRTLGYGSLTRRAEERVRTALTKLLTDGRAIERDELIEWRESR